LNMIFVASQNVDAVVGQMRERTLLINKQTPRVDKSMDGENTNEVLYQTEA